jgi:hypothetical protein
LGDNSLRAKITKTALLGNFEFLNWRKKSLYGRTSGQCPVRDCPSKETRIHFLFTCGHYADLRRRWTGKERVLETKERIELLLDKKNEKKLMWFVKKAKRRRLN